jgi:FMN-dependent NADH-azoreductase
MNILHIDSSALGDNSASRAISAAAVAALRAAHPGASVTYRDLVAQPLSHVDGPLLGLLRPAPGGTPGEVSPALRALGDEAEAVMAEFLAADVLVVGAPMYNFSVPSVLKAWIDRLAIAGRTFRYTANGPEGLVTGKRMVIASARGSALVGKPFEAALDHQEAYLRALFGFLGLSDVVFVRAEGLGMGPEAREASLQAALQAAGALR